MPCPEPDRLCLPVRRLHRLCKIRAGLPVLATDEPDPIFAAIEAHKAAVVRYLKAVEINFTLEANIPKEAAQSWITVWETRIVETDDPRWIESELETKAAGDAVFDIPWGFVENPPTTVAGVAALLAHSAKVQESCWPEGMEQDMYRALAGALGRIAGGAA